MVTAQWQQESTVKKTNKTSLQSTQDTATFIHFNTEILLTIINLRIGSEKGLWEVTVFVISKKWKKMEGKKDDYCSWN